MKWGPADEEANYDSNKHSYNHPVTLTISAMVPMYRSTAYNAASQIMADNSSRNFLCHHCVLHGDDQHRDDEENKEAELC